MASQSRLRDRQSRDRCRRIAAWSIYRPARTAERGCSLASGGMPMPVSRDLEAQHRGRAVGDHGSPGPRLRPSRVNFSALPTRLARICRRRPARRRSGRHVGRRWRSPARAPSIGALREQLEARPPPPSRSSKSIASSSSLPASILEKSRMSLMIASSASPERRDRLRVLTLLARQRRVEQQRGHPHHAVHRVRISWLMVARKSLLARFAASADSLASRSSSSARLRSVMSL